MNSYPQHKADHVREVSSMEKATYLFHCILFGTWKFPDVLSDSPSQVHLSI